MPFKAAEFLSFGAGNELRAHDPGLGNSQMAFWGVYYATVLEIIMNQTPIDTLESFLSAIML